MRLARRLMPPCLDFELCCNSPKNCQHTQFGHAQS